MRPASSLILILARKSSILFQISLWKHLTIIPHCRYQHLIRQILRMLHRRKTRSQRLAVVPLCWTHKALRAVMRLWSRALRALGCPPVFVNKLPWKMRNFESVVAVSPTFACLRRIAMAVCTSVKHWMLRKPSRRIVELGERHRLRLPQINVLSRSCQCA
jgi:hypothetical protein